MNTRQITIIDYIGKIENGIVVTLGITEESEYYDAILVYGEKHFTITFPEERDMGFGSDLTTCPIYADILNQLSKQLIPYDELVDSIDEVNWSDFEEIT
jgi:hypothetical protein